MNGKSIRDLRVGDSASLSRAFSMEDVERFAAVSGDSNPAHLDEAYAQDSIFGGRVVHGMLAASLFSALLGTRLPGLGTIYTGQTLKFTQPVYPGERITATITLKEIIQGKNRAVFDCVAQNEHGQTVILGEATVMPPVHKGE